jgi:hypothetical protein
VLRLFGVAPAALAAEAIAEPPACAAAPATLAAPLVIDARAEASSVALTKVIVKAAATTEPDPLAL